MTEFDEKQVTHGVHARFATTKDDRQREIVEAMTVHLHNFIREVRPSQQEWGAAIEFLTEVGHWCKGGRQEFILLSDVLGASMLVDALVHDSRDATDSTVLGPFYVEEAPQLPQLANLAEGRDGIPLFTEITVSSAAGQPIGDAAVDVWHSDTEGFYDIQREDLAGRASMRGTFRTDETGRLCYWSILPSAYPIPTDGPVGRLLEATGRSPWRPAHVHFKIAAPGYVPLVTQIFVSGGDFLDTDAVLGVKPSLVVDFPQQAPGTAPDGTEMSVEWHTLNYRFTLTDG